MGLWHGRRVDDSCCEEGASVETGEAEAAVHRLRAPSGWTEWTRKCVVAMIHLNPALISLRDIGRRKTIHPYFLSPH